MATLRGRDELQSDKKKMREIISEYKALKLEQVKRVLKYKEPRLINSIITMMGRDNTLYIHDDICSTKEDWRYCYDPDIIKAFWLILDLWDDIKFHMTIEYPGRIRFMTEKDTYDVIVAHKGEEEVINMYYKNFSDKSVKCIIVVDNLDQMTDFNFGNIFAYCIISEDGKVIYYRKESEK